LPFRGYPRFTCNGLKGIEDKMSNRQYLTAVLNGETPDVTPFSIYSWMMDDPKSARWQRAVDQGLGLSHDCRTVRFIEHGVQNVNEKMTVNGDRHSVHRKVTPIGTLQQIYINGWLREHYIKTPADYKIMQWVVEHTELLPQHEEYAKAEEFVGERGVTIINGSRTPIMSINVDWAGTEQFCLDMALEVPELHDLFAARKKTFMEETRLIAAGPGRFVRWGENLATSMYGPRRYEQFLMSVYNEAVPIMERGGKRAMVHYDGPLNALAPNIAAAPFHVVESLTEPPEGDMMYDDCRRLWPEKVFWGNFNVGLYASSEQEIREAVIAKRNRAGKKGFALEISEELPANWEAVVPIILETLRELR
jgi:hypothetical protein